MYLNSIAAAIVDGVGVYDGVMSAALDHDAVRVIAGSLYVVDVVTGDLVVSSTRINDNVVVAPVVDLVRAQNVVAAANRNAVVKGTSMVYLEALQDAVVGVQFDCVTRGVGVPDADQVVGFERAECNSVGLETDGIFVIDVGGGYTSSNT